jgi:hypothetical protein
MGHLRNRDGWPWRTFKRPSNPCSRSHHRPLPARPLARSAISWQSWRCKRRHDCMAAPGRFELASLRFRGPRGRCGVRHLREFGLTAEEVGTLKANGYHPRSIHDANPELRETIDLVDCGFFSNGDRELFRLLVDSPRRCIDTALASPEDISPWQNAPVVAQVMYLVQPRSMVLLALRLRAGTESD